MIAVQFPIGATLKLHWPGAPIIIAWSRAPTSSGPDQTQCGTPEAEGEFLFADACGADPSLSEIADVICCPAVPADMPDQILRRYPGCAVTAAPNGGRRCRVVTPAGYRFTLTVAGSAIATERATALGACFAYCWLAAGWPAGLLESAALVARAGEYLVCRSDVEDSVGAAVAFNIFFEF